MRPAVEILQRMASAATTVVDCMSLLHEEGSNVVAAVVRGHAPFTMWEHYPPNDVYDPNSQAQYYFHAHPREGAAGSDCGHFHTFLRAPRSERHDNLVHLIAISMTPAGLPDRLFTTNRWVTGETWYAAKDVVSLLHRFSVDLAEPSRTVNRWVTAMLTLFRPQIERLLAERDLAIERWQARHSDANVLEDRRLEVTSSARICLYGQVEWLDQMLDGERQA